MRTSRHVLGMAAFLMMVSLASGNPDYEIATPLTTTTLHLSWDGDPYYETLTITGFAYDTDAAATVRLRYDTTPGTPENGWIQYTGEGSDEPMVLVEIEEDVYYSWTCSFYNGEGEWEQSPPAGMPGMYIADHGICVNENATFDSKHYYVMQ